ncbi:MAG: calcium-binding protein [Hyphomicrobium sp.]
MAIRKGTAGANKLTGTGIADSIFGFAGNDVLFGLGGDDLIFGGLGNDQLRGGAGRDRLYGEAGNDVLRGEADADRLYGGAGNDYLDGGLGRDIMQGGVGNDVYIVNDAGDVVIDLNVFGGGVDTVRTRVSYVLPANIEALQLEGTALNGTGNAFSNTIVGNFQDNVLDGGAGNDSMVGLGGNDTFIGGTGADTITGNLLIAGVNTGNDFIYGGAGADVIYASGGDWIEGGTSGDNFVFNRAINAGVDKFTVGVVADYHHGFDVISIGNYEDLTSVDDIVLVNGNVPDPTRSGVIIYGYDTGLGDYRGPIIAATLLYYDNQLIAAISSNGVAPSTVTIVV